MNNIANDRATAPAPASAFVPRHPAPDVTLSDLQCNQVRLRDLRRHVVLPYCWIAGRPYCRSEWSALQKSHEQYRDQGVVILAVDVSESGEAAQVYTEELGLTFLTLLDEKGGITQSCYVRGIPISVFIGRRAN